MIYVTYGVLVWPYNLSLRRGDILICMRSKRQLYYKMANILYGVYSAAIWVDLRGSRNWTKMGLLSPSNVDSLTKETSSMPPCQWAYQTVLPQP
jgi:hypothetical protein